MLENLKNVTLHCTISNEEYWIWFVLQVLQDLPTKIIICDTGSDDLTFEILKFCKFKNIEYRRMGKIKSNEHVLLRNELIKDTKTDWFAIVDGDEIWSKVLWQEINYYLNKVDTDIIVVPNISPFPRLGYIGHGDKDFSIAGVKGEHYAKIFRIKNDLKWSDDFSSSFLSYSDGTIVSGGNLPTMRVMSSPMTHLTMLPRSSNDLITIGRNNKLQIGQQKSTNDFLKIDSLNLLPEILFSQRPDIVKNPFLHENYEYKGLAPIPFPFLEHL